MMGQQQNKPLLEVVTIGGLQLRIGGEPIKSTLARKAEALLIYLAVTGVPQQREVLAELFWEGRTQTQAQSNLRTILTRLRKDLGAYLTINRYSVEINQERHPWVDVKEIKDVLYPVDVKGGISSVETASRIEKGLALYRGEFLEGFYLRGCSNFENWLVRERELIRELVISQHKALIDFYISLRDYRTGMAWLRKILILDPLLESAHKQLMYLLIYDDQREAALTQYETCKRILKNELGLEPSAETTAFYEAIRTGEWVEESFESMIPEMTPFLEQEALDGWVFVGRDDQLAQLESHLEKAMLGSGRPVLVRGEAGSGKTTLVSEFARRALDKYPTLLVANGRCNSFSGQADAYFPFHQILETLCCVKSPEWPEDAERLWEAFPQTITTVLTNGPDLIDKLIDPDKVMAMAYTFNREKTDWLKALKPLIQSLRKHQTVRDSQFIIDMYTNVLAALSRHHPLLILLDDLQWVDNASTSLLFDLIRKMSEARICMIGMYRPSEVFSKMDGQHPFKPLIYEVKTHFGDTEIDLDSITDFEAKDFMDAILDVELNQLDGEFRKNLFTQTGGNPLFTIELLRTMQDRGDIQQRNHQGWVANADLRWEKLPAKVEGVIGARLAHLNDWSRELLEVASVAGEEFDSHILAQVLKRDEREVQRTLVRKLGNQHRLVVEIGEMQNLSLRPLFRFSHNLFQTYLYSGLSSGQLRLTHKAIAEALEKRDPENIQALAYHYSKADDKEKAIHFLLKVGDKARLQYALREAVAHYIQALELIEDVGDQELASVTWMKLALTYQAKFDFKASDQAFAKAFFIRSALRESYRQQSHPPAPHALRYVTGEPLTVDPTTCYDNFSGAIVEQLFSGLVTLHPSGNVLPDVATSWDILDGGKRFLFHLREDSFWSDGVPVTAGDFEFAIKRALNPKTASPHAILHYEIVNACLHHTGQLTDPALIGIKSLDDHTLEFKLENPTSYFLQLLGAISSLPIPRHTIEQFGDHWTDMGNFVSNGAFRLDSWVPGESMVLKKNPGYHGPFEGNLPGVEITFSKQVENPLQAYLDDEFDFLLADALTREQHVYARQFLSDEYFVIRQKGLVYVGFDTNAKPFEDPRVRRALALALDRNTLVGKVFLGAPSPASGGLIPPGIPGHSPDIALPFDPARAQLELAEAGFPAGKGFPVIEGIHTEGPIKGTRNATAQILQEMWLEHLGIQVNWSQVNWEKMREQSLLRKASILIGGWSADYLDPHNFFVDAMWNRLASMDNLWDHPQYKSLIQKAKTVLNQEERINLYKQADRIIVEEAAIIPLNYGSTHGLHKPWVKGLTVHEGHSAHFKNVFIEEH